MECPLEMSNPKKNTVNRMERRECTPMTNDL